MDELIIRVLSGTASTFEEERLKRWRSEASENEAHYLETSRVWDLTAPEEVAGPAAPPADAVLRIADSRPSGTPATRRKSPLRSSTTKKSIRLQRKLQWGLALAASMVAVTVGLRMMGESSGTAPVASYATGIGESRTVTLADGSFVRLAPESRLRDWSTEASRRVALSGRAFFAVAHDADRPFTVETDAGAVTVLGTRFELSQSQEALRAVVVEGRVSVSNDHGAVEVTRGSVATVIRGAAPRSEISDDVYSLLNWPGGVLVFQGTPLGQAAEEVSRHFGRTLEVSGERLEARRISAWFDGETFDEIAESLCVVAGAECTLSDSAVVMRLGSEEGGV